LTIIKGEYRIGYNKHTGEIHMTTQPNATYDIPMTKVTNPYSNESTMLTPTEHKLYIEIKQAEFDEDYTTMQKKLSKFSRLNAKAFMVLLD